MVDLPKRSTQTPANVPLRGVSRRGPEGARRRQDRRRPHAAPSAPTRSSPAAAASGQFVGLTVGLDAESGQATWNVVGIFEAGGSVSETEIWGDAHTLQGAFRRSNTYQSVLARLESPDSVQHVQGLADQRTRSSTSRSRRETEYYAAQSEALTHADPHHRLRHRRPHGVWRRLRRHPDDVHGGVDPHARDRDAARAGVRHDVGRGLGAGRVAGARRARRRGRRHRRVRGFNGYQTSTINFQTFSQVAFAFAVTPWLLVRA